ncbi:MFS transporter [Propionibacterium cyclohexanicum]|uniref:MFS transporter n=1 Tax=Propionibacterium cyclohexanicum TaxID=64702 RepID=UPI00115F7A8C|nr:MFS transporter [Propionibacterium cyclohexanicum]
MSSRRAADREVSQDASSPGESGGQRAVVRARIFTLTAMCLAQFMLMLDVTIVNIALPSMQRELHLANSGLEWVISAYSLSLAALIPFGGALGDRFGRKRWFLTGLLVFTAGSIGCALSSSGAMLVTSRAVQGIGGALMVTLTLSIVTLAFPQAQRAWAIGLWGSLGGLGFGAGPLAGGLLLAHFRWSAIFWVNVPLALVTLLLTWRFVQESPRGQAGSLDIGGVVLSGLGLVGLVYGLIGAAAGVWASPKVIAPLVIGLALLIGFVRWERVAPSPMMPLDLFGSVGFTTGMSVYFFNYLALNGVMFYMALLYQDVKGWSVLGTGLSWLFMNIPFVLASQGAAKLTRFARPGVIVVTGAIVEMSGVLLLSQVGASTPFALTAAGFFLLGLGPGLMTPTATHMAMSDAPAAVAGSASGVLNASRQLGSSVGLAVLGALGAAAAGRRWADTVAGLPAGIHAQAEALLPAVAGGRLSEVTAQLGEAVRPGAVDAFTAGSRTALLAAGVCMLICVLIAVRGLRHRG